MILDVYTFADIIGIDLVFRRYANQENRFIVTFEYSETKDNKESSILCSTYGEGGDPILALQDYCEKIQKKVLVFNATSKENRKEYNVPELRCPK